MPEVTRKEVDELKQNFAELLEIGKERKGLESENSTKLNEEKAAREEAAKDVMAKYDTLEAKQTEAKKELEAKNAELEKAIAKMTPAGETGEAVISQKSIDLFNKQLRVVNPEAKQVDSNSAPIVKSAFDKAICGKESLWTPEEKAAINSVIDPQGGYVTAPQYEQTLINKKFDLRGVISLVNVKNVTGGEYIQAVDDADYDTAEYLNELANVDPADNVANYKLVKWNPTEQIYKLDITRTELEDSFIQGGIENDVIGKARQGIIRKTAAQVVLGNGVDRPRGILTYDSGTGYDQIQQITSGTTVAIKWDDVINLLPSALGDAYHDTSAYAMQRSSFFGLLTSTDGAGQISIMNQVNFFSRNGISMEILGHPVKFDAGISDFGTIGNLAVIFGDFKEAYTLAERIGFSIIVDNVTSGQVVTYRIRRRNDGRLRMGRALKILKVK